MPKTGNVAQNDETLLITSDHELGCHAIFNIQWKVVCWNCQHISLYNVDQSDEWKVTRESQHALKLCIFSLGFSVVILRKLAENLTFLTKILTIIERFLL